jgi:hypothetical protein
VFGEPTRYPFDDYQLVLGVIQRRVYPDGSMQTLSGADAQGHLVLTMHAEAPRIRVQSAVPVAPETIASIGPQYSYTSVSRVTLVRPLTIRILATELILLVSVAAAFAVFSQAIHVVLVNIGGLILGMWGIRAILLGPDVNGLTIVDYSLSIVIVLLLTALIIRILAYTKRHGGLSSREK